MANADPAGQNIFTFKYNDAGQVLSIGTAIPAVCIVIVALRFLTRILQHATLGLDDWLSLGGLVGSVECMKTHFQSSCMFGHRSLSLGWEHV